MSAATSAPGPAGSPLLLVQGVNVRFGGVAALTDVTVELRPGEVLGLIGPNGAGKTTLVNVLSGFQRPTNGRVWFDGHDITSWSPHRRARSGLVRTFQAVRLFLDLSVAENLQAAASAGGLSVAAAAEFADDLLTRFSLAAYASQLAADLPHGVGRRVGILRALATKPRAILLDEPAAGLNEVESDALGEALHEIRRDYGCAMVIIEHDMRLIMSRCDRIQVLASGATLAVGSPDAVRTDPGVIEAYLGAD